MKKAKRLIALVLSALMLFTSVPAIAGAASAAPDHTSTADRVSVSQNDTDEGIADSGYNAAAQASVAERTVRQPVVVADFEGDLSIGRCVFDAMGGIYQWESAPGDYDLVTGHYMNGDGTSRGGNESAETVDLDSGEPVRFGNQSLKLNYDFTNINGIEGACVGFPRGSVEIPGNPTGVGLWFYNPEGGRNFWLRIRLLDGNNNILTLDYTKQREGINWFGWQYVEADLTTYQGPFKLLGGETVRLMHTYGAYDGMGNYLAGTVTPAGPDANSVFLGQATCKGSVYIDNIQFVYGANVDDVDNPVVDSVSVNNEPIVSGKTVVGTGEVSLSAYVSDVQNEYTTGIDYDTLRIYVDGENHTFDNDGDNACVITEGDGRIDLYGLELADGDHSVTIRVRDKFGNEVTETRYFTVDTGGASGIVGADIATDKAPVLGTEFELPLVCDAASDLKEITATVKIDSAFKDFTVEYADGFKGDDSYDEVTSEITLKATGSAIIGNNVATLRFPIDPRTVKGTQFTYSVPKGSFTLADGTTGSFAHAPEYIYVTGAYQIATTAAVVGYDTTITVTDASGLPAKGVDIKKNDGTLIGTTGDDGTLTTGAFTETVAVYSIYAEKDGAYSFIYKLQSVAPAGKEDGTPFSLMLNASDNSETEKNITWLSNPAVNALTAIVQYAERSDYEANGEAAFRTATGAAELVDFLGSADVTNNFGAFLNTVVVSGLTGGTDYVYRAGDGEIFSKVYSFTTPRNGQTTNFFIIGDTQTCDGEIFNIASIQNQLATDGTDYDFGAQLGDFVEKGDMYADWQDILTAYDVDSLKNVDQIHVIGNHESFGYPGGTPTSDIFATKLYNLSGPDCYSVEYGNVYAAVINYTNSEAVLQRCIDWLKTDAAKTTCQWKILLTHQPSYGTNAASMDTEHFTRLLPPVLEELGFDFMFSGHDHAYARTRPVTGGEVDEENGVVYFVCGSTGEKSYLATNNPAYNFAVCTQEYENGIYLTVEATDEEITVTTRESNGAILDMYTKSPKTPCMTDGHSYVYASDGYLECTVCGYSEPLGTYSGFAKDKDTGRNRYFEGGKAHTGWLNYGTDVYYFDENGLSAPEGKQTLEVDDPTSDGKLSIEYEFDADGKQKGGAFVYVEKYDIVRCYRGENYVTGWYELDGYTYYFATWGGAKDNGKMYTGKKKIKIFSGQEITYVFDKNGRLTDFAWYTDEEGTRLYWGQNAVTGWKEYKGETYYFDPATALMKTGEQTVEGEDYAFADDGKLLHEGKHNFEKTGHTDYSCTTDETDTYTCSICKLTREMVIKVATGHEPSEERMENNIPSTCSSAGSYDLAVYCTVCGQELTRETFTIPKTAHQPGSKTTENLVPATCTEEGSYDEVLRCAVCWAELSRATVPIDKTAHNPGQPTTENIVPSTCTEAGSYDEVVCCTMCGTELTRAKKALDLSAHKPGQTSVENVVPATCKDKGSYEEAVYCIACGAELSRTPKAIEKLTTHTPGETKVENIVPETCAAEGSYDLVVYCTVCEAELSRTPKTIEKKRHTEVTDAAVAPTCTATGLTEGKHCSVCNAVLVAQQIVHAKGHTEVTDAAVAPTCTATGLTEGKHCSVCNAVLVAQQTVPAKGHTEETIPAVAATCTEEGFTAGVKCSVCGTILKACETVPAKGHVWDDGEITKPATATDVGEKTFTCTVCKETRVEKLVPQTVTDPDSGVGVTYDESAYSQKITVRVTATETPEGDLPAEYEKTFAVDITTYINGKEAEPTAPVTVTVPVPEGFNENTLAVYHVKDDGTVEKVAFTVKDGKITFAATGFSVYVIADTSTEITEPAYTPGDVDNDGNISAADARLALRASVKLESFWDQPDDAKFKASDVDKDGKISASDARKILRVAVKLETL